jgi:hypothetical protein
MAKKIGGIWFFRLGRLRFSFCIAKVPVALTGSCKLL